MSINPSSEFLRRVLLADAISCTAMGLLFVAFSEPLEQLLAIPAGLLRPLGWVLLPFAAVVAYVGSRAVPSRKAVWAIMGLNAVWIADSVLLLFSGWIAPTLVGQAFIVTQALFVLIMTELEYMGLKRADMAAQ